MASADGKKASIAWGGETSKRASGDDFARPYSFDDKARHLKFVAGSSVDEVARRYSASDQARHLKFFADSSNGGDRGWSLLKKALQPQSSTAPMVLAARLSGSEAGATRNVSSVSDNRGLRARWQEFKDRENSSKAPASWPVPPKGSFFLRRSLDKLAERAKAEGSPDAGDVRSSGSAIRPAVVVEKSSDTLTKLDSEAEATHVKASNHFKATDTTVSADDAMSGQLMEPAPEPGLESDHSEENHDRNKDACKADALPEDACTPDALGKDAFRPVTYRTSAFAKADSDEFRNSIAMSLASSVRASTAVNRRSDLARHSTVASLEDLSITNAPKSKLLGASADQHSPHAGRQEHDQEPKPRIENASTGTVAVQERDGRPKPRGESALAGTVAVQERDREPNPREEKTSARTVAMQELGEKLRPQGENASAGKVAVQELDGEPNPSGENASAETVAMQDHDEEPTLTEESALAGTVARRTKKLEIGRLMTNVSTFSAAGGRARLARRRQKGEKAEGAEGGAKEQAVKEPAESTDISQAAGSAAIPSDTFSSSAADDSGAVVEEGSEEHFNAFGELDDGESRLRERVLELEKSRGVTLPESAARDRIGKRQKLRATRKLDADKADGMSEHPDEPAQAISTAALVANFLVFAGYSAFQEQQDDEGGSEEEHNAWGEEDNEENLQQRTLELEEARGFAIGFQKGPAKTNARARLAKKKKRHSAQAPTRQEDELPGERTEPHENESDEEFNPWGEDDTPERKAERMQQLETGQLMVNMPTFAVPEADAGRKRLAKRKQKGKKAGDVGRSENEQVAKQEPESTNTGQEEGTATTSSSAATLIANVFGIAVYNPFGESHEAQEVPEEHNAWGEADTEEQLHQRTLELDEATRFTSRTLPTSPTKTNARTRLAKKIRARLTRIQEIPFPEKQPTDQHGSDEEFNPWGEDDSAEKTTERMQELETARHVVNIPTFQMGSSKTNRSRDRLAKKKEKAKAGTDIEGAAATVSDEPGYLSRLLFGVAEYDDFDEDWNMWGEADSHEDFMERLAAFEDVRRTTQQSLTKSEHSHMPEKTQMDIANPGASTAVEDSQETLIPQAADAPPAKLKHPMKKFQLPVRAIDRMKRRA